MVNHDKYNKLILSVLSDTKGVDLTGLLGGLKRRLVVCGMEVPVPQRGPPEAEAFFVKLHIIFALKYNKKQYIGGHYHGRPPFINIGGTCPPCPIGIDAPV